MRKLFATGWLILSLYYYSSAQNSMIDSLNRALDTTKQDTSRARILYFLSYYHFNNPDTALILAQSAYQLSKKVNYQRGQISSLGMIALAYKKMGNSTKALETYLEQLKILEKREAPEELGDAYLSIAMVYNGKKDFQKALFYAYKADSIARHHNIINLHLYTTLDIGDIYTKNDQLDSALLYTSLSYKISIDSNRHLVTGTALNNMGNIHLKAGEYSDALADFRSSIPFLLSMQDFSTLSECYLGLSEIFANLKVRDSALFYANRSYSVASENQFLLQSLHASQYLTKLYKANGNIDSAFAYQEIFIALKDSFDNTEKIKELQVLTMNEQFRQDEIAREKLRESKQRLFKLEFLLIGMLIPVFFFLSAYISRKKVHKRVIELSGIFSLIFLFEYITLLIHPYVKEKANHSPVYEILFFVAIAAILSPTHHKVEYWLISKLTRKHHQKSMPLHS